jgi:hypothetical protein
MLFEQRLLYHLFPHSTETVQYSKKNMLDWTHAGVDYNSLYLIVNLLIQLSTPTAKGKGWSGNDLSYWLSTFASVC